jgi:nitroreductase
MPSGGRNCVLRELIRENRSYRRFFQDVSIETDTLRGLVDLGRLSASGKNRQPLKYILSNDVRKNALIFPHLRWAANLPDWAGPAEGERPSAYIVILSDRQISPSAGCDHCIAAQSIMLGAAEMGLGGCMIRGIARDDLRQALAVPERYAILLVLALGKPKEDVVIDAVGKDGDTRYWRDEDGVHHVPKRSLDEVILTL